MIIACIGPRICYKRFVSDKIHYSHKQIGEKTQVKVIRGVFTINDITYFPISDSHHSHGMRFNDYVLLHNAHQLRDFPYILELIKHNISKNS